MITPEFYEFMSRIPIYSGKKALNMLPDIMKDLNVSRPLIVTDKGIKGAGLHTIVLKALSSGKSRISRPLIFDETPVDSDINAVSAAAQIYRKGKCDSIIALGGGSVLDTAKGINILVSFGGDNLRIYSGEGKINKALNPLIAIPTTSGTGSEVTNVAIVNDPENHIKQAYISPFLIPHMAILDPRMTATLPHHITAMTAMDALTHACEAYIGLAKNPLSDTLATKAISLITRYLPEVLEHPGNMDARLALANAAALAGIAFSNSMVGIVHNLSHALGAVCHIPHGLANAILLPYGLEYNLHKCEQHIGELLYPLAGPDVFAATPKRKRAEAAIAVIRKINETMYINTAGKHAAALKDIMDSNMMSAVPKDILPQVATAAMKDGASVYNPEEISEKDALTVLQYAWEGTPLNRSRIHKGKKSVSY